MVQGRCMKCKVQVEITKPVLTKTVKGVRMVKGVCGACGTVVCRIGG